MANKETYKCLNPIGTQAPVDTSPLAQRLDSLDGKTIHLNVCGEPDINIPLEKKLRSDYPNVNWRVKKTYDHIPVPFSDEEMKTCDGVVLGVCW
ncbi:hypothetical protein ACFLVC_02285 [Chloroflexota bacterium]